MENEKLVLAVFFGCILRGSLHMQSIGGTSKMFIVGLTGASFLPVCGDVKVLFGQVIKINLISELSLS